MSFDFTASYLALWCIVIFQSLVVIGLLVQIHELKQWLKEKGLPVAVGHEAPRFSAIDTRSGDRVSTDYLKGRAGIILFVSPYCQTCTRIIAALTPEETKGFLPILAVCQGEQDECKALSSILTSELPLVADEDGEIAGLYRLAGVPTAVIVDSQRRVRASAFPSGIEDLRKQAAEALGESKEASAFAARSEMTVERA